MRVNVDEARADDEPAGINFVVPFAGDGADGADESLVDGNVADERLAAGAVDDGAAANDDIVVHDPLPL